MKAAALSSVVLTFGILLVCDLGVAQVLSTAPTKSIPKPRVANPLSQKDLQPGLYEAVPFIGIVIISGAGFDERAIISPKGRDIFMPMAKPEVRLLPRRH